MFTFSSKEKLEPGMMMTRYYIFNLGSTRRRMRVVRGIVDIAGKYKLIHCL